MRLRTTPLVALTAACCIAAYWLGSSWFTSGVRQSPAEDPEEVIDGLVVERAALDLGRVWEEKGAESELTIRNRNHEAVDIEDFEFS
jgi:hypothetical protein